MTAQNDRLSVVIPTFDRLEQLKLCLASFDGQTARDCIAEVVVVNDGATDGTVEWLQTIQERVSFRLVILTQENRGPAAARNAGVRASTGDFVLFTGDDCQADPHLVERHLKTHQQVTDAVSVLGHTTWLPTLPLTPFMHFQENGGSQFAYWRIQDPNSTGWPYYYTTNISTPRRLLLSYPFEERFRGARFEDLELGYRLDRSGYRITYQPEALVFHDHPITPDQFIEQCEHFGQAAVTFHRLYPEDHDLSRFLGVSDARSCTRVCGQAIEAAQQLRQDIEALIPQMPIDEATFGHKGAYEILAGAYRLLVHHALISAIRRALNLPALAIC